MVLSSLERRYQLTSLQVGLVASVFDMAVLVSVIFVSYFAGKGHKPRWLGVGLLIQGLGTWYGIRYMGMGIRYMGMGLGTWVWD